MGNNQTDLNNSGNQVENVPVWVKPYLTIDEATAYTGIGQNHQCIGTQIWETAY